MSRVTIYCAEADPAQVGPDSSFSTYAREHDVVVCEDVPLELHKTLVALAGQPAGSRLYVPSSRFLDRRSSMIARALRDVQVQVRPLFVNAPVYGVGILKKSFDDFWAGKPQSAELYCEGLHVLRESSAARDEEVTEFINSIDGSVLYVPGQGHWGGFDRLNIFRRIDVAFPWEPWRISAEQEFVTHWNVTGEYDEERYVRLRAEEFLRFALEQYTEIEPPLRRDLAIRFGNVLFMDQLERLCYDAQTVSAPALDVLNAFLERQPFSRVQDAARRWYDRKDIAPAEGGIIIFDGGDKSGLILPEWTDGLGQK